MAFCKEKRMSHDKKKILERIKIAALKAILKLLIINKILILKVRKILWRKQK